MKTLITASMLTVVLVANTAQAQFRLRGGRPGGTQTFGQSTGGIRQPGRFHGTGTVAPSFRQRGFGQTTGFSGFGQQGFQSGGFSGLGQQSSCPSGMQGTTRTRQPRRAISTRQQATRQTVDNPWGNRPNQRNTGGRGSVTQRAGVPQNLQGVWFDISPEGNLWTYVVRADSYDMFEVNPRTNQQVVIDGQPVQVENGPLTFRNGVLHLSPQADVEEGPFATQPSADGTRLTLSSTNGDAPRTLTRQRQI